MILDSMPDVELELLERELLEALDGDRAECAAHGHLPVTERDYWSQDAWTVCGRCGVAMPDDALPGGTQ